MLSRARLAGTPLRCGSTRGRTFSSRWTHVMGVLDIGAHLACNSDRKMLRRVITVWLLGLALALGQSKPEQEGSAAMSDRGRSGLRGRVKSCTEERAWRNPAAPSGSPSEIRSESVTEYDAQGRILSTRNGASNGSTWVMQYQYSASGQLLKIASGKEGEALTEATYSYDPQGQLQAITDERGTRKASSFRYDEHGRKTRIEISRPEDYRPNVASGGGPFESLDRAPNLPGGGSATTIYDEHDRPSEVQVRDPEGQLVSRAVRAYDAQGRILEEKQILENVTSMFPPEAQAKLLKETGLSAEQLRRQLHAEMTTLTGGESAYSMTCRYDSGGHPIHTSRRAFNRQEETETTYNEHGDKESEITTTTQIGAGNEEHPPNSYSEVRYSYAYDQQGNWTEQRTSYRPSPNGSLEPSTVVKRTLVYFEND